MEHTGGAPRDLRDWIARVEAIGQLKHITAPLWNRTGSSADRFALAIGESDGAPVNENPLRRYR